MNYRVGIDLGTTNSAIAYTELGQQRSVKVEDNEFTSAVLPSCVSVRGGKLLVGAQARRDLKCVREFKRHIGSGATFALGDEVYTPIELSALVLGRLKEGFESLVGPIEGAVITVPANFTDRKRAETEEAGRLAGLQVLRLINEPSAAAIAYAKSERPPGSNAIVIDWGGGTLDVSLVDCLAGVLDIKANDGEERCGGKDLDESIFSLLEDRARHQLGDRLDDPAVRGELMLRCEEIKIRLSSEMAWDEPLNIRSARTFLDFELSRAELDQAAIPHVNRVMRAVKRCLDKAPEGAVRPEEVTDIILVGGSCNMPILRHRITEFFGQEPRWDQNPMEVVAQGAAYQAEHVRETGDLVTVHSLTHSLGVSCAGPDKQGVLRPNLFSPILEATTKLPARAMHSFATMHDDQDTIRVQVFEALVPDDTVESMTLWGEREINGLPPAQAGSYPINIAFDYSVDQKLSVHVEVPGHGISHRWVAQHVEALEGDRQASEAKLSRGSDRLAADTMRDYVTRVRSLELELPPGADTLLLELEKALGSEKLDRAKEIKSRLGEVLFDAGISLGSDESGG